MHASERLYAPKLQQRCLQTSKLQRLWSLDLWMQSAL